MLWTPEAVEKLKTLALSGKSASHIAEALGTGSRNAVIGKASRIGIKLTGGGRAAPRGEAPPRTARRQWANVRFPRSGGEDPGAAGLAGDLQITPRGGREAAWAVGEAEVGEMLRLRFEDIRESACRWPLGDPRSRDFAYCGLAPAGGQSYCAGHCRMAYRPPQARPGAREGRSAIGNSWRVA